MTPPGPKSPAPGFLGGTDDDFSALDAFGPSETSESHPPSATRMLPVGAVSRKSGVAADRERARALNISMATTLIEPLPANKRAAVETPDGGIAGLEKSVTVLGRASGVADILVPDDGVSRQHAAIVYAQGDFFLEDLGSSNGTHVNGEKIGVVQLTAGMEFSLGSNTCRFLLTVR